MIKLRWHQQWMIKYEQHESRKRFNRWISRKIFRINDKWAHCKKTSQNKSLNVAKTIFFSAFFHERFLLILMKLLNVSDTSASQILYTSIHTVTRQKKFTLILKNYRLISRKETSQSRSHHTTKNTAKRIKYVCVCQTQNLDRERHHEKNLHHRSSHDE